MDNCYAWCPQCGKRFTEEETRGQWGCPSCGCQSVPCGGDKDVWVEVNWHELHILGCFAERWAQQCAGKDGASADLPKVVYAIARRLQRQWPTLGPLTLGEEISSLPADLEKAAIHVGKIEHNIETPKPTVIEGPGAVGFGRRREQAL